jgi:hypothetical protein
MRLGLWALVSLNVGAFYSQGDEGAQVLAHLDEFVEKVLSMETTKTALTEALERMSRGAAANDTLKLRLLQAPGLFERLVDIVANGGRLSSTARNHAVKVIEAISDSRATQQEMVSQSHHTTLIELMSLPSTSLYAKKALATTICNLASLPANAQALGEACAVTALVDEQASDPRLRRKRVELGASRLAAALLAAGPDALSSLPPSERALVERLGAEEAEASAASTSHRLKATLVESGVLLYLHTAAGGAVWGLVESLRARQSRSVLVQNVLRTALVTCFVPILMVGGVVTAYTRLNRTTDSVDEKFAVYFSACVALYPASRLFAWVEAFAPLWLGAARRRLHCPLHTLHAPVQHALRTRPFSV